jgi:hypothetical protein
MSSTISLVFTNIAIGSATCSPLDTSLGRESEIPVLVNILEKVALRKFSIRGFGSVSVLGSQTLSLRTVGGDLHAPSDGFMFSKSPKREIVSHPVEIGNHGH